jgi:hypothetical protein
MTDADIVQALPFAALFSFIPATIAKRKGYPFWGWWFLGLLFSFVIMTPIAIFARRRLPPA